jgi:hypothetical protein
MALYALQRRRSRLALRSLVLIPSTAFKENFLRFSEPTTNGHECFGGDARGQRRPSFVAAAPAEQAKNLYEEFAQALRSLGVTVATGVFGAMMSVELLNEGPVTILLDSDKTF